MQRFQPAQTRVETIVGVELIELDAMLLGLQPEPAGKDRITLERL
ncbi:hypothetical protein PTKU15_85750 [Paraburkholderia terrae]|nr:hypothetical protein PTKU15_85750 [Paraburkholderia terrae]